jgi:hypothetical protein
MSSLAKAVRRPQLKYTSVLLILSIWIAQAAYYSYSYRYITNPELQISLFDGMMKFKFLGRAIAFTFIAICLLRSWTYVFPDSDPVRRSRTVKLFRILLIRIGIVVLAINLWNLFLNSSPRKCEEYTKLMTGNMHYGNIVQGGSQLYEMQVCEVRSLSFQSLTPLFDKRMRLQIFSSPKRELLAERIFYWSPTYDPRWDSSVVSAGCNKVDYGEGDDDGYAGRISLPPTKLDWLRARLP